MSDDCTTSDWCPFCDHCGDDGECWICGGGTIPNHDHERWVKQENERIAREMAVYRASIDTPW